jgi:succinylglutamate desuccinylase
MKLPKRVVIIGGTHGNEWTGIALIKHYQELLRNKFPELNLEFVFGNPEAHQIGKRYKDEDLNRASQFIDENRPTYEAQRAREIREIIQKETCVVIDLHTTTSQMGNTLIISQEVPENLSLCALIQNSSATTKILLAPDPKKKYLASQSTYGLMIEVGPIANNVIAASILEETLKLLVLALSYINHFRPSIREVEVYEEIEDVYYPQDSEGNITAYIHSEISGRDYAQLDKRFKAFMGFDGREIEQTSQESAYPIFINEAAYYPIKLAFTLCRKTIKKI